MSHEISQSVTDCILTPQRQTQDFGQHWVKILGFPASMALKTRTEKHRE